MRVLLDATAVPADRGGVGRYVDAVLPGLAARVDVVVVCQPRDVPLYARLLPDSQVIAAPATGRGRALRFVWEQVRLPRLARGLGADVVHSPHYTMPLLSRVPVVVTLHDATFFSHPDLHSVVKGRFFRAWTRLAVRRAAVLVVPSEATAREVRRYVRVRTATFRVAHHGVDTAVFHPVDDAERTRVGRALGLLGRPWVAFLGTLEPRKNVPALVRGWVRAVGDLPDPPVLVLAGGRGWDEDVDPAVAAVPAGLTVLRPGYLPLEDLAGLLGGATVVAYPSLGEGFGLPVLEAMACGAPVLTTRELSLPEVGGDAVAYCGTDETSIADALGALLADEARRDALAAAARERAARFTWDAAAQVHVQAYREAAQRARSSAR